MKKSAQILTNISDDSASLLREIRASRFGSDGSRVAATLRGIVRPPQLLLDPRSAAKTLGISLRKLRRQVTEGKIHSVMHEQANGNTIELIESGPFDQGIAILLNTINAHLRHIVFVSDGTKLVKEKSSDPNADFWIRVMNLLHEFRRDKTRLKICGYCGHVFWDQSPNKVRTICGEAKCLRIRSRLQTQISRESRKLLNESKPQSLTRPKRGK